MAGLLTGFHEIIVQILSQVHDHRLKDIGRVKGPDEFDGLINGRRLRRLGLVSEIKHDVMYG